MERPKLSEKNWPAIIIKIGQLDSTPRGQTANAFNAKAMLANMCSKMRAMLKLNAYGPVRSALLDRRHAKFAMLDPLSRTLRTKSEGACTLEHTTSTV